MASRALTFALIAAFSALAACEPKPPKSNAEVADYGGTMVISALGDVSILVPPFVLGAQDNEITDILFDRLAELTEEMNTFGDRGFSPELAAQWTWGPDSLSIAFHLDPRARWHDGQPVTARDVHFTFQTYRHPEAASPHAPLLANIDSVTVRDSLTAVFFFTRRYGEQFYDAAYQMRIMPAHLLDSVKPSELRTSTFARRPIGSGLYRLARWEPGSLLELNADTANYRGRPFLNRLIWSVSPDPASAATKLFAGEADFIRYVRPVDMGRLAEHKEFVPHRLPPLEQGVLHFNLRDPGSPRRPHPLFGDRATRRAISMAIDRPRLVRSVFDSLAVVAVGPALRVYSTADTTIAPLPYDPEGAKRLLDSLGWRDSNGDGVRDRGGRPLRFTVAIPSTSTPRVRMAVLLQEMLRQIGIDARPDQMEFNVFNQRNAARQFDATLSTYGGDPSPSAIRQTWSSEAAAAKGSSNYSGYANPAFDALVDSAITQMDVTKSVAYFRRAYAMLVADAPAVWLYEPITTTAVHKRIRPSGMRADAWWAKVGEWKIPAAERLDRDEQLRTVAQAKAQTVADTAKRAR